MARGGRARKFFCLVTLLLVFAVTHAKKSKRWTYPRPQWPVPEHPMADHPCRLFLWDVASAARFCESSRLVQSIVKTSLWEDSHKQLWLRVPHASPLLRVFPCQQHSLSRCLKCGHDYHEHVEWAVEKNKDSPFNKLLRESALLRSADASVDYREVSVLLEKEAEGGGGLGGGWGKKMGSSNVLGIKNPSSKNSGRMDSSSRTNSDRNRALGRFFSGRKNAGTENPGIESPGRKEAGSITAGSLASGKPRGEGRRYRGGAEGVKLLAALAEAQRTTLLQLSGVSVTSAVARAGYEEARESERRAAAKRDKANRGGGGGGGGGGGNGDDVGGGGRRGRAGSDRDRTGMSSKRTRGRRRRRSSSSGGGGAGRDNWGSGAGGGVTDRQVGERNVRAFDQINYV